MKIDINLPTPRTDAEESDASQWSEEVEQMTVPSRLARELERENAALRNDNAALREALMRIMDSAIPDEFEHPSMFKEWTHARAILAATEP